MITTTTMMFWGAEADCKLKTGYSGRLVEIRDIFSQDYVIAQLASKF